MDTNTLQTWLIPALFIGFFGWRFLKFRSVKKNLSRLLQEGAVIVDVRSSGEYSQGSSPGSINIPLDALKTRSGELDRNRPVILCCASGTRSGMAAGILKSQGFTRVLNAGPWQNTLSTSA